MKPAVLGALMEHFQSGDPVMSPDAAACPKMSRQRAARTTTRS